MSDTAERKTNAEWAEYYGEWGWQIFPVWWINEKGECACDKEPAVDKNGNIEYDEKGRVAKKGCRPGKHPIPFNGLKAASNDPAKIKTWWENYPQANIGIATGMGSGLLVIDADGDTGVEAIEALGYPKTVTAQSGSGSGRHYFFTHPGDKEYANFAKSHKDLPGVDFRGDGGYIILPPSNHDSGGVYTWVNDPDTTMFTKLPTHFKNTYFGESTGADGVDDDEDEYVEEGRNNFLTRKAGILRRAGMDEEFILAGLRKINDDKCRPPLPDDEIVRIARNIGKKPTGDSGSTPPPPGTLDGNNPDYPDGMPAILHTANLTDAGNAECFAALYGQDFRYCRHRGKAGAWYHWNGTIWEEDESNTMERYMVYAMREREASAINLNNKQQKKLLIHHAHMSENTGRIQAAIKACHAFPLFNMPISDFDSNIDLITFQNGTYNLRTGEFREARREDYITRQVAVDYDPEAKAPRWEKFISEIMGGDDAMTDFLQRVVGYCITGEMSEQVFFILYGLGANGKSTFLSVLQKILQSYTANVSFDSFDADNRHNVGNDLAQLPGARLVTCIESEHNKYLAEARIKSITGGDPITCRFLFGEFFTYTPQFKTVLAVNHLPIIRGSDNGIWRRVLLVPFNQSFDATKADKNLQEKLLEEAAGVLNWCLDGTKKWQERGLTTPETISDAIRLYKYESDQISRWIEDRVSSVPGSRTTLNDFYNSYKQWAIENGERQFSKNFFQKQLRERGYDLIHPEKNGGDKSAKDSAFYKDVKVHIPLVGMLGGMNRGFSSRVEDIA